MTRPFSPAAPKSMPPSDLLFSILVTFLTPLFLGGATGNYDVATAQAAAIESVRSFRIRGAWDLIKVVQIVGFGIAALGSIDLSMREDLSLSMVLRCRSNANALQRSSDRAEARLEAAQAQDPAHRQPAVEPLDPAAVQEAFRQAAEAQQAVAAARARLRTEPARPDPRPARPAGRDAAARTVMSEARAAAVAPASRGPLSRVIPDDAGPAPATAELAATGPVAEAPNRNEQIVWAEAMATV